MPVTRSELLFFSAGVVVGAIGHAAAPKLKEKFGPLVEAAMAGMGDGLGDRCAEMARTFAEKVDLAKEAGSRVDAGHAARGGHATSAVAS